MRRTDPHAAPGGIDETPKHPPRALVLSCPRCALSFGAALEAKAPARRGGSRFPVARKPDRGYFFPFFAGFALFAGAFLAAGFFGAAFFAAGFAGRGPGFAIEDGLPSEATSAK